jgi:signal transduction histidine kinase
MRVLFGALLVGLSLFALPATSMANGKGSAEEAVAMVKKAVALIKSDGRNKAFAAISDAADPNFHDRDLYIYVYGLDGMSLAHGNNPKMIGRPHIDLKDNEGNPIVKAMIDVAKKKGKGWIEYKWPNPITKEVETKSAYVELIDNMVVGSGIYK